MKSIKTTVLVVLVAVFSVSLLEYFLFYGQPSSLRENQAIQVHISIVEVGEENFILKDNILLLSSGSTALDALLRIAEVQYTSYPGMGVFVNSIDGKANTATKWWLYKVNNVYVNVSASRCILENGDNVVWEYTSFFPF
ncbi:MAG: DUF4430 domain-containing protein [Candidatus Hadarchaeales archaeon]